MSQLVLADQRYNDENIKEQFSNGLLWLKSKETCKLCDLDKQLGKFLYDGFVCELCLHYLSNVGGVEQ